MTTLAQRPAATGHQRTSYLIVSSGGRACALPLAHVSETMRPLRVEPVGGAPPFVLGVSVIRGASVPVVDLASLLGEKNRRPARRWVSLNFGQRSVALSVDDVHGVELLDPVQLSELPPVLSNAEADAIDALGVRDAQLLLVLRAAYLVPEVLGPAAEPRSPR